MMGRFYLFATGVARQHPHANTRTATRYQCYAFRDQYVKIEDVGFNLQEHNSVPCCLGVCVGNALINECGVHVCILSHNCHCVCETSSRRLLALQLHTPCAPCQTCKSFVGCQSIAQAAHSWKGFSTAGSSLLQRSA